MEPNLVSRSGLKIYHTETESAVFAELVKHAGFDLNAVRQKKFKPEPTGFWQKIWSLLAECLPRKRISPNRVSRDPVLAKKLTTLHAYIQEGLSVVERDLMTVKSLKAEDNIDLFKTRFQEMSQVWDESKQELNQLLTYLDNHDLIPRIKQIEHNVDRAFFDLKMSLEFHLYNEALEAEALETIDIVNPAAKENIKQYIHVARKGISNTNDARVAFHAIGYFIEHPLISAPLNYLREVITKQIEKFMNSGPEECYQGIQLLLKSDPDLLQQISKNELELLRQPDNRLNFVSLFSKYLHGLYTPNPNDPISKLLDKILIYGQLRSYLGLEIEIPKVVSHLINTNQAYTRQLFTVMSLADRERRRNLAILESEEIPSPSKEFNDALVALDTIVSTTSGKEAFLENNDFFIGIILQKSGFPNVQLVTDELDPRKEHRGGKITESFIKMHPQHKEELEKYQKEGYLIYLKSPVILRKSVRETTKKDPQGGIREEMVHLNLRLLGKENYSHSFKIDLSPLDRYAFQPKEKEAIVHYIGLVAGDSTFTIEDLPPNSRSIFEEIKTKHSGHFEELKAEIKRIAREFSVDVAVGCAKILAQVGHMR